MTPLDLVNIDNITTLWHAYGATPLESGLFHSQYWPNKLWLNDQNQPISVAQLASAQQRLSQHTQSTLTVWQQQHIDALTTSKQWTEISQLLAMNLELHTLTAGDSAHTPAEKFSQYAMVTISDQADIAQWVEKGSEGFGYQISADAIRLAVKHPAVSLLSLVDTGDNNAVVGTALVLNENNNMGVHQITLAPTYRGKGLGKLIMQHLITNALNENFQTMTLQASAAGKPLYEKLGFTSSFPIVSFRPTIE